jgi:hypothetical protein
VAIIFKQVGPQSTASRCKKKGNVLNSESAVQVSVRIIDVFVRLREAYTDQTEVWLAIEKIKSKQPPIFTSTKPTNKANPLPPLLLDLTG